MPNNIPFLRIILEANNADQNKDMVDCFTRVMNPVDRDSVGKDLVKVLGYNPVTLFDHDDIHNYLEQLITDIDGKSQLALALRDMRSQIEDAAFSLFNERRLDSLQSCVLEAAEEILPDKFTEEFRAKFIESRISIMIEDSIDDLEDEFEEEDESGDFDYDGEDSEEE